MHTIQNALLLQARCILDEYVKIKTNITMITMKRKIYNTHVGQITQFDEYDHKGNTQN